MTISDELTRDYDDLAALIGVTPRYDSAGELVPVGQPEDGNEEIHLVYVGRCLGGFYSWGLASAMVSGFPGATHKKYRSLARARMAWRKGPVNWRGEWGPPVPRPALRTPGFEPRIGALGVFFGDASSSLPREVSVTPPSALNIPVTVQSEEDGELPDEERRYWEAVDALDKFADGHVQDPPPLSPTISHMSSLSLAPSPSLTAGTISPGPVSTPTLSITTVPSSPRTPHATSRTLACHVVDDAKAGRPMKRIHTLHHPSPSPNPRLIRGDLAQSVPAQRSTTRTSTSSSRNVRSPADRHDDARRSQDSDGIDRVTVRKPKECFVVVRGRRPGIYFDRNTAIAMLGTSPGMKLVMFQSLSRASWYFVQAYMAQKVGVPVLEGDDYDEQ